MKILSALATSLALTGLMAFAAPSVQAQQSDDLHRYVAAPSPHYKVLSSEKTDLADEGLWRYEVKFQSVKWRSAEEVSKPVWTHKLVIYSPKDFGAKTIAFEVGGGVNGHDDQTSQYEEKLAKDVAIRSGLASAVMATAPNQPLMFNHDGRDRYEDEIIAYGWDKFLTTGDVSWLPLFPMVKSTHLGMDTVVATLAEDFPQVKDAQFVMYGASKRGWTTWLTAATSKRVAGIAPIVIDMLNTKVSLINHRASLGKWSEVLKDYVELKITERIETPEMAAALKRLDPLNYVDSLMLPKYILNAANDQFFTPDSSTFYYSQLKGPKWLRYFPNQGHSRRGTDFATPIATFALYVAKPKELVPMHWQIEADGQMSFTASQIPDKVILWQATNPETKDFRLMSADFPRYQPTQLSATQKVYTVKPPLKGYKSVFYEFHFSLPHGHTFTQSTSAVILKAPSAH